MSAYDKMPPEMVTVLILGGPVALARYATNHVRVYRCPMCDPKAPLQKDPEGGPDFEWCATCSNQKAVYANQAVGLAPYYGMGAAREWWSAKRIEELK